MDVETYRGWIEQYDREGGPQWLVTPEGWRDALREALDRVEELEGELLVKIIALNAAYRTAETWKAAYEETFDAS